MAPRKKKLKPFSLDQLPNVIGDKLRGPLAIVLGNPIEVIPLIANLPQVAVTCFEMDHYPAQKMRDDLAGIGLEASVVASADLWDLPADFQTVVYSAPRGGERALKIDMVEQAYHILQPGGHLIVASPFEAEQLFPKHLKKVFGKVHVPAVNAATLLWTRREQETDNQRPRRRHEITFQVRSLEGPSVRFRSRPGVFSYGRMDDGARALVESAVLLPGDQVMDLGCGCGTNGVLAAQRIGTTGSVTFVDSNLRAIALAEINARENGLTSFKAHATATMEGLPAKSFDVILANPPYFAYSSISKMFVEKSRGLLRPGGCLYLVTRQPNQLAPLVVEAFGHADAVMQRGYTILAAKVAGKGRDAKVFQVETEIVTF